MIKGGGGVVGGARGGLKADEGRGYAFGMFMEVSLM